MAPTRLDRLHDALVEMLGVADAPSRGELAGALGKAGLELREAGSTAAIGSPAPPPLSFVIRHTACELALHLSQGDANHVLQDAEKFRVFLAGEGPAPTDQHGGTT